MLVNFSRHRIFSRVQWHGTTRRCVRSATVSPRTAAALAPRSSSASEIPARNRPLRRRRLQRRRQRKQRTSKLHYCQCRSVAATANGCSLYTQRGDRVATLRLSTGAEWALFIHTHDGACTVCGFFTQRLVQHVWLILARVQRRCNGLYFYARVSRRFSVAVCWSEAATN